MAICKFDKSVTYGRKNLPSGVDLVTLMGQNAELEQTGDPAAGKSQATGSPGRAGLVRHPSLPGGRGSTERQTHFMVNLKNLQTSQIQFFNKADPPF